MKPLCFSLLLLLTLPAHGQDNTWKKTIGRFINLHDFGTRKKDKANQVALITAITDAVKARKITVYDPLSIPYEQKLNDAQINELFYHKEETDITDPIDGHVIHKVIETRFIPKYFYQYKVIEDWTFDPQTGKTNITIKYIAPVANVYGDDGELRGKEAIFWMKYADLVHIMEQHNKKKLLNMLAQCLLDSHFEPYDKEQTHKTHLSWERNVISTIDVWYKDTLAPYLQNVNWHRDSTLADMAWARILNDQLIAWPADNINFSNPAMKSDLVKKIMGRSDTQVVIDPIDGHEVMKIIKYDPLHRVTDFGVLQHWTFDPMSGKIAITIKGTAPITETYRQTDNDKPRNIFAFWIGYSDLQPILKQYEQCHPTNTFPMRIWNSYFLSTIKPEVVK